MPEMTRLAAVHLLDKCRADNHSQCSVRLSIGAQEEWYSFSAWCINNKSSYSLVADISLFLEYIKETFTEAQRTDFTSVALGSESSPDKRWEYFQNHAANISLHSSILDRLLTTLLSTRQVGGRG